MGIDNNPYREISRQEMKRIWECAKSDNLEHLNPDERCMAKIMIDHEDEYFSGIKSSDELFLKDFDPETEQNPFMHFAMHQIVENQLKEKTPIEVYQFYTSMRRRKVSHHECLHLIAAVLMPFIFQTIKHKDSFDKKGYINQLVKLKGKKPEKIWSTLDLD